MTAQQAVPQPFGDLPEGTVTFLFSDIEGSTQLLYQLGDQFTAVLAEHHRILREAVAHGGGQVVRTEGDSFFVAFPRATDAVAAAAEAQRALGAHPWPEGASIRVRMGLHTGEAEVALDDYVGIAVHRAARIAHAGYGGQVLLSETTTALVQDELPTGVSLLDLGRHLLKDIRRPEQISQLAIEGLPAEFPPLKTLGVLPPEGARLPRSVGACPYRGLAAFREEDASFYCGREGFVDQLERAVRGRALTAVIVGSSGSGKSSALFAGLLPRLRSEGGWQFALLRPGAQPFYALAGALLPLLEAGLSETDRLAETRKLAQRLAQGDVSLSQVVERIQEKAPEAVQLLLVVDQFEELYTLCADAKVQQAFIDELLAAAEMGKRQRSPMCVILLTMRADFMGQALAYRPFADTLQEGSLLMGPMTREELRAAIEKPAEMQGAAFEAGLVERILDDVGEKPGNLPLLEFTLTLLWERQTDGWLTHEHYEAMGGVEGALATYADQVYSELEPGEQEQTRQALVQLVRPGEGTEDTRRVATREELGKGNWKLAQHLADRRLVVVGRDDAGNDTAEVVHEALIQRWGRFREWMDADRAFRAWQERLRSSLRQWQETGQDEGALLAGAPLLVAQNWLADRGGDLSEAEAGYIREGQALEARRQKERERRRRTTILALAGGLIVALVLSFVAFQQRQAARMQAGILLASQAESELEQGNADRAVLLALAALENYPYTVQAEHALGQAVTYNRALALYEGHMAAVTGAAWSSDGRRIATSSTDNSVHIWDSSSGELLREINLPEGITGNIYDWALAARWSPGDRYLLTISGDRFNLGSQDYDLILWDAESGERIAAREVQNTTPPSTGGTGTAGVHFMTGAGAAFASDGRLATLGGDNSALVWNPMLDDLRLVLNGHTQGVNAIAWSPDFTRLATASEDGTARIWDAESGQELIQLAGHSGAVNQAVWSPDGSLLATAGDDGNVWLWDGMTGETQASIQVVPSTGSSPLSDRIVWTVAWSPDGAFLATGSGDGSIRVWDVNSGEKTMEMKAHDKFVAFLEWSPVDDRLVSAGADGRARVWNSARDNMVLSLPYEFAQAQWSPDGAQIAVGTEPGGLTGSGAAPEGLVAVWDLGTGQPVFETHADKDEKWGWIWVEYSPDGMYLLSRTMLQWPDTTDANKYYVFDSQSGEIVRKLETSRDVILLTPGWSPDGQLVAGGDFEGTIYFWEPSSGELVSTMSCLAWGHIVRWSPDGSKIAMLCFDFDESVNAVQVVDAETHELLQTIEGDLIGDAFMWFGWSPDSTRIAVSGGNDETGQTTNPIYVYDVSSGEMLLRIDDHAGMVASIGWSPDGKRLVSSSTDDTTRIWDAETGAELLTLSTPGDWLLTPDWSPDGQHLLVSIYNLGSRGRSGVWRVWQTTDELVAYAKECCVIRQLTDAERAQFGLP